MKTQIINAIISKTNIRNKKTMEVLNTMSNTQLIHLLTKLETIL